MRVLFVTEEPIDFSGTMVRGGQIHIRNVISGLQSRGHDIHLIDWNDNPTKSFQHSISPSTRFVDGPLRTFRQTVSVGQSINPDIIISKTRKTYLPGLVAARQIGVPHIVHVGSSLEPPIDGAIDWLDAKSFVTRLRAPHDGYFVVCEALSDELCRRGVLADKLYNVRNAVDTTRFKPNPDIELPDTVQQKLVDRDGPLLGFVGGLTRYKGVFDLAKAIDRTDINPTVIVAGDGPARNKLNDAFGEQGIFLGGVPYERMPAVYAAVDALVLPSHTEGLPRVILEAGAAGLPVIATNVGGVPEVLPDGETGLLCPPKDPDRLAAAIDELFTERNPSVMGEAARQNIVDEYTWTAQYDRYEEFLSAVINRRR